MINTAYRRQNDQTHSLLNDACDIYRMTLSGAVACPSVFSHRRHTFCRGTFSLQLLSRLSADSERQQRGVFVKALGKIHPTTCAHLRKHHLRFTEMFWLCPFKDLNQPENNIGGRLRLVRFSPQFFCLNFSQPFLIVTYFSKSHARAYSDSMTLVFFKKISSFFCSMKALTSFE